MKIQVTNRQLWLDKVNTALHNINIERAKLLTEYHALPWYRKPFCGNNEEWSQLYAWCDEGVLKQLKRALESDGTGDVYVYDGELRTMEVWQ